MHVGDLFTEHTDIKLYYAGMPFIRSVIAGKVKDELIMFLGFSALITAFIMLLFFRSWMAVVFPMIISAMVWLPLLLAVTERLIRARFKNYKEQDEQPRTEPRNLNSING